jgi:hypothetical protein
MLKLFKCVIQWKNNHSKVQNNNDMGFLASTTPKGGSTSTHVIPLVLYIPTGEMFNLLNRISDKQSIYQSSEVCAMYNWL